jgi:hypothetical protein
MDVYIFASDSVAGVSAITSDKTGANLPPGYGPWRVVNGGNAMTLGPHSDPVAIAVPLDGYRLIGAYAD